MINIMLVAGDKTEKLSEFLKQRGTFNIDFEYRSLSEEILAIKDSIINVDKLVYLLDDQLLNIRTEMQTLKELLINDSFFTVREVLFLIIDNSNADKAVKYFTAVMTESHYENFNIIKTKEKVSFADIFDYIIGGSYSESYKNTFKDVYRVERNSESSIAYIESDDIDLIVEPFNYDRLATYEVSKANSKRVESGILHKDTTADTKIEQFDNPDFGDLQIKSTVTDIKTIIVTGERKTGVSTWASALAVSAVASGETVTLIDFTDNYDISRLLESNNQVYYYVRMLEMLHNYKPIENSINLVSTFNEIERTIRMEFLQHVYSHRNSIANICIIAVPEHLFTSTSAILVNEANKLLYCINPIISDITMKQETIASYSENKDFLLVLNKCVQLMDSSESVTKDDITSLLPFDLKVIQAIDFEDLTLDSGLYNSLMEV